MDMCKLTSELKEKKGTTINNNEIQKIINTCYQCGKCSEVCPISKLIPKLEIHHVEKVHPHLC